jgi:hypothetical protein
MRALNRNVERTFNPSRTRDPLAKAGGLNPRSEAYGNLSKVLLVTALDAVQDSRLVELGLKVKK